MLSIASSSTKHGTARRRRSTETTAESESESLESGKGRHLKAVDEESEPDNSEVEIEMGANTAAPLDGAGIPIEGGPDPETAAAPSAALESTPATDYSTIGAYLHELRRYPLMTREEEHEVAVEFSKTAQQRLAARLITANLRLVVKI